MPTQNEFRLVFKKLKKVLEPFANKLTVTTDTSNVYSLNGPYSNKWKKELFFGSVQVKKNYVSFYLMPVYMCPELLNGITPKLKKHMQGKSCFNFKKVEPDLFNQLSGLTKQGYDRFKKETVAE